MSVRWQKWITRADLQANPTTLYLFGDNELRRGKAGQAKEMRGEPNAVGIRTKRLPATTDLAYWTDKTYEDNIRMIREDLEPVFDWVRLKYGDVVVPESGIGTGLSRLDELAPATYGFLMVQLIELGERARDN